jgi:hypothetical protein
MNIRQLVFDFLYCQPLAVPALVLHWRDRHDGGGGLPFMAAPVWERRASPSVSPEADGVAIIRDAIF